MSQLYIHDNLVRIKQLVHKILCRQESVTPMPTPTPTGSASNSTCPPPLRYVCDGVGGGGGGGGGGRWGLTIACSDTHPNILDKLCFVSWSKMKFFWEERIITWKVYQGSHCSSNYHIIFFTLKHSVWPLSVRQTKTDTCANSVDLDETARNEPSHLDLLCLPFLFEFRLKPYFHQWICPNSRLEESTTETQGRKG